MRRGGAVALLFLGAAAATPAAAADYRLDGAHSFIQFEVLHFGTSTLRGRLGPVQGQATLDSAAGHGRVALVIPLAGLSTGWAPLDRRLREPDLFDVATYPDAYFVASQFHFADGTLRELRGELTVRGTPRPIALQALRFGCRPDPEAERERCGGDFEAEVRRSDFGMTFGLPLVADHVRLRIQVEGLREP